MRIAPLVDNLRLGMHLKWLFLCKSYIYCYYYCILLLYFVFVFAIVIVIVIVIGISKIF